VHAARHQREAIGQQQELAIVPRQLQRDAVSRDGLESLPRLQETPLSNWLANQLRRHVTGCGTRMILDDVGREAIDGDSFAAVLAVGEP